MQKYRNAEVKKFEFNDLKGTHVVSNGSFQAFEFQTLDGETVKSALISQEDIRQERNLAAKNNFKIDAIVSDLRGLSRQEQNDLEERIQAEVQKRLETAYAEAYEEGLQKGREEGREASMAEFQGGVVQKVEELAEVIAQVQEQSEVILKKDHHDVYEFIKRFTKWITMKEVSDAKYMELLLEKLILELNSRKNLIIKVGKANFAAMPEVIKAVEERLGQLSNVRVEIVSEINHPGIILEGENGLIDGSLESVFKNIDKIFEQVVKHE